jgi:hypothetical protein
MNNKNLLIGLGVAVVAYFLWKKNKVNSSGATGIQFSSFTPLTSDELLKINNQNGFCQNPSPATIQGYDCFKDSKKNTWIKITKNGLVTWNDSFGHSYNENGKDITLNIN